MPRNQTLGLRLGQTAKDSLHKRNYPIRGLFSWSYTKTIFVKLQVKQSWHKLLSNGVKGSLDDPTTGISSVKYGGENEGNSLYTALRFTVAPKHCQENELHFFGTRRISQSMEWIWTWGITWTFGEPCKALLGTAISSVTKLVGWKRRGWIWDLEKLTGT